MKDVPICSDREEANHVHGLSSMYFQLPRRPISRPGSPTGHIFAVGRRIFVNSPTSPEGRVVFTGYGGEATLPRVTDGAQVEIPAWRPRGLGGARYHVHSVRDCREGWLATENLRAVRPVVTRAGPVGCHFAQWRE